MITLKACLTGLVLALFSYTICVVACIVLLATCCILPRTAHNAFAFQLQQLGLTAMMWFLQERFDFVLYGDLLPPNESALVLCNHQSDDWVSIYCLALRKGNLGAVRCFLKKSLTFIPGFGWAMYLMSWPNLSRDWEADGPYLKRLFESYRVGRTPLVLWIFPEGTRLTKDKLEASQAHAREKGYPVLNHVLLPRHRAFGASIPGVAGAAEYCYDCTVAYSGWGGRNPTTWDFIFDKTRNPLPKVHLHVRRIPLADLPTGEEELRKWLLHAFEHKDVLLAGFQQDERFPGEQRIEVVPNSTFLAPLILFWMLSFVVWGATFLGCRALFCA